MLVLIEQLVNCQNSQLQLFYQHNQVVLYRDLSYGKSQSQLHMTLQVQKEQVALWIVQPTHRLESSATKKSLSRQFSVTILVTQQKVEQNSMKRVQIGMKVQLHYKSSCKELSNTNKSFCCVHQVIFQRVKNHPVKSKFTENSA